MLKKKTWLVQRLNRPVGDGPLAVISEGFSFGGGYRNGGLSEEAMALLRPIFSFDYMGSAEFEFGAVPETLGAMADRASKLSAFAFAIDGVMLYAIADEGDEASVAVRVQSWVLPPGERPDMKEQPLLDRTLAGDEWCRARGWLELDNGFFVFVDRVMWEQTAPLFGLETV